MKSRQIGVVIILLLGISIFPTQYLIQPDSNNIEEQDGPQKELTSFLADTASFNGAHVTITRSDSEVSGLNLFTMQKYNPVTEEKHLYLLILDMAGQIVASREILPYNPVSSSPAEFVNSTTLLIGTRTGALLWNYYTDNEQTFSQKGQHEYEMNHKNNTIFTFKEYITEIGGYQYSFDLINEYTLNGTLVWSLDTASFISYTQYCPYGDLDGTVRDLTHSNTIFYDEDEDVIYYNSRNTNTFYKIDHSSSEVLWGLGEYGNFTLYDEQGNLKECLFSHAHAVEKVDDNTYILFDNDNHNQTSSTSRYSKMLEITANETSMTAQATWSWVGTPAYWSMLWGDADRLPYLHRLGVFGSPAHASSNLGPRLVEVDNDGNTAWQMDFQYDANWDFGIYRMERFRFSPFLSSPSDIQMDAGNVTLDWNAWYNFRPKRTIMGDYWLYLDDSMIQSGTFGYDPYWRPSNLSFNLGALNLGDHNVSLVVSDGEGHTTMDSVNVSIGIYMTREGPLDIELGQTDTIISWTGEVEQPLNCSISVDNSPHTFFQWNNTVIEFNLSEVESGIHKVELLLLNGSDIVYNDTFWIRIYPSEFPVFHSLPQDQSIDWNATTQLIWNVTDATPTNWELLINGSTFCNGTWSSPYILNWSLPNLDEGVYNITALFGDQAQHISSDTVVITILAPEIPAINARPQNTELAWGTANTTFEWEVHGINQWALFKNGTMIESGLEDTVVGTEILDWWVVDWRPGLYNLTLEIANDDVVIVDTISITIYYEFGDPYVDSVVTSDSIWYAMGENAIGPPDANYALIYMDYSAGYITLDMGENEDIINGVGNDFSIVASGGEYRLYAQLADNETYSLLGIFTGNQSLDLAEYSLESARYLRLEVNSEDTVQLDAVIAINYNFAINDENAPIIEYIGDSMPTENTSAKLMWNVTDITPWRFSLQANGTVIESGPWRGDDISLNITISHGEVLNITLQVEDLFGNHASESIICRYQESALTSEFSSTTTTTTEKQDYTMVIIVASVMIFTCAVIVFMFRQRMRS